MKQIYNILALLALLHLLVLVSLGGYMAATGGLSKEKVEKIVGVIRGEDEEVGEDPNAGVSTSQPVVMPVLAKASAQKIAEAEAANEMQRLVGDRMLREAVDRKALVDAVMLKVTRQMEELAKLRKEFEEARKLTQKADQEEGQKFEMEILAGLSEKKARDLLIKRPPPDAARMLMGIKRRSAIGIIEACKTEAEKGWAVQMMQEISGQDPGLAKELAKSAQ